jgi:homoserine O-acetyltransferase/O-succinyltransferase
MTDWKQCAQAHEMEAPEFHFESGESKTLRLHCRTLGSLNAARNNAVLLLHGTTGSGTQFLEADTADFLFRAGQPLDVSQFFIVLPDAIGHGNSSKPSDAQEVFPHYGYADIVRAQHLVVNELLDIHHLRLVLGTSMGGMNTWMWGIAFPHMMDALMPIACLPSSIRGMNLLFRRLMLTLIESDPSYDVAANPSSKGLGMAWNVFTMMISGQAELAHKLLTPAAADLQLADVAKKAEASQHPRDAVWEFLASSDYDPYKDLEKIVAPLLAVNFADDLINASGFSDLGATMQRVRRGSAVLIDAGSRAVGHKTLAKAEVWNTYVRDLLKSSQPLSSLRSEAT